MRRSPAFGPWSAACCLRSLAGLLAVLIAAGCATRPTMPEAGIAWDQRELQLIDAPSWRAQGRIAVKSGSDGGQGNIVWVQQGSRTRISLSGPFGAGAYEIEWDDEDVVVYTKAGELSMAYAGRDAVERFLDDQLGWSFPARSMRYWIMGVADPDYAAERSFDETGWLAGIDQHGWVVTYGRFMSVDDGWLPRKVAMENPRARVKLVIDRWTF